MGCDSLTFLENSIEICFVIETFSLVCLLLIITEARLMEANIQLLSLDNSEEKVTSNKQNELTESHIDGLEMKAKRSAGPFDYLQEIVKCCPEGFQMDNWYSCEKNVGKNIFTDELLEIGAKDENKYVIVNNKEWKECPVVQRKEFEVLHIPHDKNHTVYVFVDVEINYDVTSEEEINFDGFREMKYACLEVSKDHQSITALVCGTEEEEDDEVSLIKKCCPDGQGLARDYSSCSDITHQWIPPRSVLHHKTMKMTGDYHLLSGQELCGAEDILIVETAHAVTTDGLFKDMSEMHGAYHCVDTLVQDEQETELVALICLKKGCTSDFCVSKCCPENEIFVPTEGVCSPALQTSQLWTHHNKIFDNQLNQIPSDTMDQTKVEYLNHFLENTRKYQSSIINCEKVIILDKSINNTFFITQNGSLYVKDHGFTNDFCVDNTVDDLGNVLEVALKCVETTDEAYRSDEEPPIKSKSCLDEYIHIWRLFNTVSGSISCVFLAITFLVYIFVPELNNLHGKIVLSNVFTIFLLTAYILFIYNSSDLLNGFSCKIAGYSGYFLTMAMFSWMTIMSFDLCWTFMRARLPSKGSALLKFVIYSAVAWGFSLAITIVIILADQIMEDDRDIFKPFFPKPNVGLTKCFLEDTSQGIYLHVPIFLFMLVNGMLFITTTLTLYKSSQTTQKARNSRQRSAGQMIVRRGELVIVSSSSRPSRINKETKEQLMS